MSEPSEVNDARRLELITAAQRQWIDALTDLGERNTLLYYKDRRAGTLDLATADPDVLERFEKTGHARLTKLFTDADERADAIRRMQSASPGPAPVTGLPTPAFCAGMQGARSAS